MGCADGLQTSHGVAVVRFFGVRRTTRKDVFCGASPRHAWAFQISNLQLLRRRVTGRTAHRRANLGAVPPGDALTRCAASASGVVSSQTRSCAPRVPPTQHASVTHPALPPVTPSGQAPHKPHWSVRDVLGYVRDQSRAACDPRTLWTYLKIGIPGENGFHQELRANALSRHLPRRLGRFDFAYLATAWGGTET